ncbi:MAG: hypothetical protein WAQ52_07925 [Terriglobales bacterium]
MAERKIKSFKKFLKPQPSRDTDKNKTQSKVTVVEREGVQYRYAETQRSLRKPPDFRVVDSPNGPFKEIEGSPSYGANATATFIRYHLRLLTEDLDRARTVWINMEKAGGCPTAHVIKSRFGEIAYLCPDVLISHYMQNAKALSSRRAATEIINRLWPNSSEESITRMGRSMKRYREASHQKRP